MTSKDRDIVGGIDITDLDDKAREFFKNMLLGALLTRDAPDKFLRPQTPKTKGLSNFKNKAMPKYQMKQLKGKNRCKKCGFRIRGTVADHEAGPHHKGHVMTLKKRY